MGIGSLRTRRIDALSVLAVVGIGLSTVAFIGGGSAQMLQLREKLVTLIIGLAFLASAAIGKPLIYPLARAAIARQSQQALADFDAKGNDALVRHTVMMMTWVWGIGLLLDFALSAAMIYILSIEQYIVAGPILGYVMIGGLMLWTILYRRYRTRYADAVRAQAKAFGRGRQAASQTTDRPHQLIYSFQQTTTRVNLTLSSPRSWRKTPVRSCRLRSPADRR